MISRRDLSVGVRGAIMLAKSDGKSVVVGARVVYSNALGPKGFESGLEFETQPPAVNTEDFHDADGNLPEVGPAQAA